MPEEQEVCAFDNYCDRTKAFDSTVKRFGDKYSGAMECLCKDKEHMTKIEKEQLMTKPNVFSKNQFIACEWHFNTVPECGYDSVCKSLKDAAILKEDKGLVEQSDILKLLSNAVSMHFDPKDSKNIFSSFITMPNFRSYNPDDFTKEQLMFFKEILPVVDNMWLKSRLADLLWIKEKNVGYARAAVDAYISHSIDSNNWYKDIDYCFHRAIILCKSIGDNKALKIIEEKIYISFQKDYSNDTDILLSLAKLLLLKEVNIDSNKRENISKKLIAIGNKISKSKNYLLAKDYLNVAAQSSKLERNNCLLLIAENYEKEGDERSLESHGGVSHFLYGKSLEYYLKIDRKEKITTIRRKIEKSGKNARKGMITLEIPIPDMSVEIEAAKNHVSEKESLRIALLFFSTVCILPSLKEIQEIAMKNTSVFDDVMSRIIIADDGRCVANIGGHSESGGDEILNHNIQRNLQIYIYMAVYGRILPALSQLKNDHSITLPILESLCESSELVPKGREKLTSYALWLGFDSDFGVLSQKINICVKINCNLFLCGKWIKTLCRIRTVSSYH